MGFLDKFTKTKKKPELEKIKPQVKVGKETKEDVKKTVQEVKVKKNLTYSNAYRVLVRPLVSEKATIAESNNVYSFVVANQASKYAVRQAIKDVYGVIPTKIRMVNTEGKTVRHGRSQGRRNDWKKALVTLPAGKTISIHEGV